MKHLRDNITGALPWIVISISLFILDCNNSVAQEKTKISPDLQLQFFKDNSDQRVLKATLSFSRNRMANPLQGMKISFFEGKGILLADKVTDSNGQASLLLSDIDNYPANENGARGFSAVYEGTDTIEAGKSEISVKELTLEMDTAEVDSVKNLTFRAFVRESGKEKPAEGVTLNV